MNQNENKLIKELISTDLKKISNSDFTLTTLERIKELKNEKRVNLSNQADLTLIYPVFGFSVLLILFSIIKVIGSLIKIEQISNIMNLTAIISGILLNPITISLLITFTLLYLLDLSLKKHVEKFRKPNTVNKAFGG